ncbi:aminopeptidase [bacterium]|nr:aminopeptidase [bacterium]MDA7866852.1 aminopeptidase [Verrucomicrobiota bacterium]
MNCRKNIEMNWRGILSLGVFLLVGSGCESSRFYGQAISGQVGLVLRRQPLDEMIQDENQPAKVREKLLLVEELRAFASETLLLPSLGTYTSYVALDGPYVVWNIAVSKEFDLEPKSWWYPIVGRLEHRGYFREKSGRRYAKKMEGRGYDTAVGGVLGYSTLGWFSDPVLSSFVELEDVDLAELIFHELAHQRLFIYGDTDFNEAFAVSVAEFGVIQWLREKGDLNSELAYQKRQKALQDFMGLVLQLRTNLSESYKEGLRLAWDEGKRRERKSAEIDAFRHQFKERLIPSPELVPFATWVDGPINNSKINVLDTYFRLLPAFRELMRSAGDLEGFYAAVERIGKLPKPMRGKALIKEGRNSKK